jgi:hypothetical protein
VGTGELDEHAHGGARIRRERENGENDGAIRLRAQSSG